MFEFMEQFTDNLVFPKPILLFGLIIMIFLDLLTGINKAKRAGELTTSKGLRKTIDKASTYFNFLMAIFILANLLSLSATKDSFTRLFFMSTNGVVMGCVYIEVKSILENLIIINTKDGVMNDIARYLLVPIHSALILKLQEKREKDG